MLHLSDGTSFISLGTPYAPDDIPHVLRSARGILSEDCEARPADLLGALQRIDGIVDLVGYRLNIESSEATLGGLLLQANLQQGGTYEEADTGEVVFTDVSSQLAERALRTAVMRRMWGAPELDA